MGYSGWFPPSGNQNLVKIGSVSNQIETLTGVRPFMTSCILSQPWSVLPEYHKWESKILSFLNKKTFFLETEFLNAKAAQLCYPIVSEWDQCQDEFHFRKYHRVNTLVQLNSYSRPSHFTPRIWHSSESE